MSKLYTWHARAYIVRICILMVAFIATSNFQLHAQYICVSAGTGGFTPRSGTVSGMVTWSGHNQVTANVLVTGNLTIAANADIGVTAGCVINVSSTGTLTINGGADLYALTGMWDGIVVNGGGHLTMTGATIEDADIGVHADNSPTESFINITGSTFCNNETGIKLGPIAISTILTSVIHDNEFTAPFIPALSEPGDYGIYVNQVTSSAGNIGVSIGDGVPYTGSSTFNYFHELNIGIRCFKSEVNIEDNKFEDILGFSGTSLGGDSPFANTAIVATWPSGSSVGTLEVGSAVASPGVAQNFIKNCLNGVISKDYVQTYVYSNRIESDFASGTYSMANGVVVKNNNNVVDIAGNLIMNFTTMGVSVEDESQGAVNIYDNTIRGTGGFSTSLTPTAIFRKETTFTGSQQDFITGNTIQFVRTGIDCENVSRLDVNTNIIDFVRPNADAYGLKFHNCTNVLITANQVTANCTNMSGCDVHAWPLFLNDCEGFEADQNQLNDGAASMYITNDCSESHITCNEMNDAETWGVLLINLVTNAIGDPNIESSTGDAADNSWFPSSGPTSSWANRIRTQSGMTDVSGVQWRYRNTSAWFDMPGVTLSIGGGTSMLLQVLDNDGDACENPYSMRTDGDEYLLSLMEYKYSQWVIAYMEGEPDYSAYNYSHMRRFWNFVTENELQTELEGDYATLFATIDASNIPTFKNIRDAIASRDFELAVTLNEGIEPVNDIESTWQITNDIYLSNLDADGFFVLNSEIEPTLRSIAELPIREYSKGVFDAWGMLDTVIVPEVELEEKVDPKVIEALPWVYPNPAVFAITVSNNNDREATFTVEIFDALGNKVKEVENSVSGQLISVSELPVGIYSIVLREGNSYLYKDKLLIIK